MRRIANAVLLGALLKFGFDQKLANYQSSDTLHRKLYIVKRYKVLIVCLENWL